MNRAARIWLVACAAFVLAASALDLWLYWRWGGTATISTGIWHAPRLLVFALGYATGGLTWGLALHFWSSDPDLDPERNRSRPE